MPMAARKTTEEEYKSGSVNRYPTEHCVSYTVNLQNSSMCTAPVYANPVILLISFAHMPSSQLNP